MEHYDTEISQDRINSSLVWVFPGDLLIIRKRRSTMRLEVSLTELLSVM